MRVSSRISYQLCEIDGVLEVVDDRMGNSIHAKYEYSSFITWLMLLLRNCLNQHQTSIHYFFSCFASPAPYDDSLKSTTSSSVIIPTPNHERENEKYNNNNNHNNINNNLLSPSTNSISLKIEEVSNETQSNSMIAEDHHRPSTQTSATTRWGDLTLFEILWNSTTLVSRSHLQQFNECIDDVDSSELGSWHQHQQAAIQLRRAHRYSRCNPHQ